MKSRLKIALAQSYYNNNPLTSQQNTQTITSTQFSVGQTVQYQGNTASIMGIANDGTYTILVWNPESSSYVTDTEIASSQLLLISNSSVSSVSTNNSVSTSPAYASSTSDVTFQYISSGGSNIVFYKYNSGWQWSNDSSSWANSLSSQFSTPGTNYYLGVSNVALITSLLPQNFDVGVANLASSVITSGAAEPDSIQPQITFTISGQSRTLSSTDSLLSSLGVVAKEGNDSKTINCLNYIVFNNNVYNCNA